MGIVNSSETVLSFVEETTLGVTPATPSFQQIRTTGETLVSDIETVVSAEITPNADITDEINVGENASGPIGIEMTFGDADTGVLLSHALRADWATGVAADGFEELNASTLRKSMTVERNQSTGVGNIYSRFRGMRVNSLSLSMAAQQLATATFELLGLGETEATSVISGATYAAPNSGSPISGPQIANMTVGGVSGTIFYNRIDLTLSNNCAAQAALQEDDAVGIRYGQRSIEGTFAAYLDENSAALYTAALAGATASLSWDMVDEAGDTYRFVLPRTRWTQRRRPSTGNDTDVTVEVGFRATFDQTAGTSLQILRTAVGA